MFGVNRVYLAGTVGADPEIKNPNGKSLAVFRMATNRKFKRNNEWQQETQWHTIEAWEAKAELIGKFVKKGSRVMIEGEIKKNEYTNKEGEKRTDFRIHCNEIHFLDKPQSQSDDQSTNSVQSNVRSYTSEQNTPQETVTADSNSFTGGGPDDEMPF